MRDPDALIDDVATARNIPRPVQPHWPFGYADVVAIVAARDAEWLATVTQPANANGRETRD